jgi:thiol-disulfide isomerase/thioredoxin
MGRSTEPRMRRTLVLDRGFLVGMSLLLLLGWWVHSDTPAEWTPPEAAPYRGAANVQRVTANGEFTALASFRGAPVLVVYGAPWCSDCELQVAEVAQAAPKDLRVVHVVTSAPAGYGHPATRGDAAYWARRFELAPEQVLAADLTAMRLPALMLFDAQGGLLFEHTGLMDSGALRRALSDRVADPPTPSPQP